MTPVVQVLISLPFYAIVVFCCYSLAVIGLGVATFPECPDAAIQLQKDMQEARKHLLEKGIRLP